MICFGVGGNLLLSIIRGTPLPIIHSFLGLSFFFIIALFMFYSGSWGGGDGKFLMGVGALIPTYSLAIFINVAIFNVIYLVGYMLIFKVRKVKEGIPLIPVISLAIIFTLIFGNILFVLV